MLTRTRQGVKDGAGLVCALLALIFGNISMRRTKDNPILGGHGMAVAGFILGLTGMAIAIPFVVLILSAIAAAPNSRGDRQRRASPLAA